MSIRKCATIALVVVFLTAAMPTDAEPSPSDDDRLAAYPEGSYVTDEGAIAVPLGAPSPDWLTPEMIEKASLAAESGLGYNFQDDEFVHPRAVQYLFIRPGAWMLFPSWCTMNFIFGNPGNYEIGSAGHCNERNEEVVILAAPSTIFAIGKTGYSKDGGIGNDFSKTKIYSQFQSYVDPDVAVIGGPSCSSYDGEASLLNPVPVKHFGHGIGVGTGGTPRAGVSFWSDSRTVYWDSPSAPGDSGSAVLTAGSVECPFGEAFAVLTHLVIFGNNLQFMAGTRLSGATTGNGLPV